MLLVAAVTHNQGFIISIERVLWREIVGTIYKFTVYVEQQHPIWRLLSKRPIGLDIIFTVQY